MVPLCMNTEQHIKSSGKSGSCFFVNSPVKASTEGVAALPSGLEFEHSYPPATIMYDSFTEKWKRSINFYRPKISSRMFGRSYMKLCIQV